MGAKNDLACEMKKRFSIACDKTAEECIYITGALRFSVLSERILRIEKCPQGGSFIDLPSQTVFNRNFAKPSFNVSETDNGVSIETSLVKFVTNKKTLKTICTTAIGTVVAGNGCNLKGTARTLDGTNGRVHLADGIFSRSGVTLYDDSCSCLIGEDAMLHTRMAGGKDIYIFAFGHDYKGGLKEFFALTGHPPLLPKFVFGNWWSRYHAYTADEYISLMDAFVSKKMPFTVATIDMDWHLVEGLPKEIKSKSLIQGPGWTGYTFNKELIPNHKKFLAELKKRRLAVTLNLHPRDGVRFHEEQYSAMAEACGIDPASKKAVEFDLTNPAFVISYFDILHHPYEKDGVGFWWIDWQQGKKSKIKNVDPLWLLNHYHFLDAKHSKKTPLILSRYAGLGSHRYPLGFSGDTIVSWRSLKLQPYFTSTASNVGFTWWSHDIGGHMFGRGNPELYVRWLQFGVFSPINRLHSTKKGWSKEPWLYGAVAEEEATKLLRLRHRLIPYLYTANVKTSHEGEPLCRPMYYDYDEEIAYNVSNQYMFGSELFVAPVVKRARHDGYARTTVWFPRGKWTNIFTGEKVEGGRIKTVKDDLASFPVYAKEGAIIPLLKDRDSNFIEFDELEICVYEGNGAYVLRDEEGGISFRSEMREGKLYFEVKPLEGCKTRTLKVVFKDMKASKEQPRGILALDKNSVTLPAVKITLVAEPISSKEENEGTEKAKSEDKNG